jgi:ribA/ribD-fused uncharacterized protein
MSNILYDESEIDGQKYVKGDWKKVAVHDEKNIKGFFGPFAFLSNFHPCLVCHDALPFMSSEHAYMFSKLDLEKYTNVELNKLHHQINEMSCKDVKKWGKTVSLRPDWETVKYDTMASIVFDKFYRNLELREKLLATGDKYLEEKNFWLDVYWGVDYKLGGQNNLGKILMKTREFWKK